MPSHVAASAGSLGAEESRRAPVSPRRPSPRMRPLRGPRCRKRHGSTSWRFLQSSRPLYAAAMLRRTGAIGGNALRGFSGHMPGIWCRSGHLANRDARHPGALRRARLGWRSDRPPWQEHARDAPKPARDDSGGHRPRRIRRQRLGGGRHNGPCCGRACQSVK